MAGFCRSILLPLFFVAATALLGSAGTSAAASDGGGVGGSSSALSSSWNHGWSTTGDATFSDFLNAELLNPSQLLATSQRYRVLSLEKCHGNANMTTEDAIYTTARAIKKLDPTVKVLFYWATDQQGIHCYAAGAEFAARSDFWLKDDNGEYVRPGGGANGNILDVTVPAARDWWLSVPLRGDGNGTWNGQPTHELIDGVLADSATFSHYPNVSITRLEAFSDAKYAMIGSLQAQFTELNGGVVMANGISMYGKATADPRITPDDHNLHVLNHAGAIMNEHTAVFEAVNRNNASLNVQEVVDNMVAIEAAAAYNDSSKVVFVSTWPGLYAGIGKGVGPEYSPVANGGEVTPNVTDADGWRNALRRHFGFAHALFLSMATPNMYWFYGGVWYSGSQGYVPCPDGDRPCYAPPEWYPDLKKPLGAPKGTRKEVAPYVFERQFEHALVHLDLNQPNASKVTFSAPAV